MELPESVVSMLSWEPDSEIRQRLGLACSRIKESARPMMQRALADACEFECDGDLHKRHVFSLKRTLTTRQHRNECFLQAQSCIEEGLLGAASALFNAVCHTLGVGVEYHKDERPDPLLGLETSNQWESDWIEPEPLVAADLAGIARLITDVSLGDPTRYTVFGLDPRHSKLGWLLEADQASSASEAAALAEQRELRAAVAESVPTLLELLAFDDPAVRTHAAYTLAFIAEARDESVPRITEAVVSESNSTSAVSMLLALALLGVRELPGVEIKGAVPRALQLAALALANPAAMDADLEDRLIAAMAPKKLSNWPWNDGHLHVVSALLHASFERGDLAAHEALLSRLPAPQADTGRSLSLLLRLGCGRRPYRPRGPADISEEAAATLRELAGVGGISALGTAAAGSTAATAATGNTAVPGNIVAAGNTASPLTLSTLAQAGYFTDPAMRAEQLEPSTLLASTTAAGEPRWRLLSDALGEVVPMTSWFAAVEELKPVDRVALVWEAANGSFGLYQHAARLSAALTATVERFDLLHALVDRAARYEVSDGVNLGLNLLRFAHDAGLDPAEMWIRRVRDELEKKWIGGAEVAELKAWVDAAR